MQEWSGPKLSQSAGFSRKGSLRMLLFPLQSNTLRLDNTVIKHHFNSHLSISSNGRKIGFFFKDKPMYLRMIIHEE